MSDDAIGPFASAASSARRRISIAALGAMTLLAAFQPSFAQAGKTARKARKRCKRQFGQCLAFLEERCAAVSSTPREAADCLAQFGPCCEPFARCDAVDVVRCFGIGGT